MSALLQFAAFALGIVLSMRMIAALHGPVDVWHMLAIAWPRAVADILIWGATIVVIAWLIHAPYRTALVWGLSTYLVFYLSLLPLMGLYLAWRRTDQDID